MILYTLREIYRYNIPLGITQMNQIIFGGLLSTPAPTAPIVGIAFIVLFAIVGIMVGPDYEGMNAPSMNKPKEKSKD